MTNSPKTEKLTLTFCGGVGSVTGANFLLTGPKKTGEGEVQILVDCGLEQGSHEAEQNNRKPFIYKPSDADFLLITHAHMDHIGRIPKLVRDGFKGIIYSTPETKALSQLMLADALKLTTQAAERLNLPPLYDESDVRQSFNLWKSIPYHKETEIEPGYSLFLKDAGHVLGSTMYEVTYTAEGEDRKRKIVFTGDLGNSPTPLLRDTEDITDADYMVMESVYGDRNHDDRAHRLQKLTKAILENKKKDGIMLIPIFSLEKTQELLYEIHKLIEDKVIPPMPIYLDSPLAINLTEIYKHMSQDFNEQAKAEEHKHDIFSFPGLHVTTTSEESKAIVRSEGAKIIMAGSGMSNGGRIQHHEVHYLSNPNNTILFIGYQAVGTLGRAIQEGAKQVEVLGTMVEIRAAVENIDGYSSHKDSDHLVEFVEKGAQHFKKVFVVMGETKTSLFLVQRLRDYLGVNASHPEEGDIVTLE